MTEVGHFRQENWKTRMDLSVDLIKVSTLNPVSTNSRSMTMEEEKMRFLEEFGQDYGYPNSPKTIDQIRSTEFKRLQGLVYLDHGGATLYSELQMESILKDLNSTVYGNPHSQSDSSSMTSEIVRAARQQVLDYCNASPREYKCIFTSGATGSLKLVGEAFPWSTESCFMYTMENHNSVLGIREYALDKGAMAFAADIEAFEDSNELLRSNISSIRIEQHPVQRRCTVGISGEKSEANSLDTSYNLFAFPSECNFSGMKFSPDLVKIVKEDPEGVLEGLPYCRGRWMVLIDAAKGCATQPPDLTECPADFVAISFYKIFGYPTGLGALLVRNEAAQLLKKTYFSGGTVAASIADTDFYKRRESIEESFEDGTQSFLNIAAIYHGFKIINTLTISAIARHTKSLATYARRTLLAMRHENGAAVCTVYGNAAKMSFREFGPTIAFNLKHADGAWVGYHEVEKLASLSGIQLRTGCFCNPGACSKHLGLSHADILSNIEAGHICWDDNDILGGKPTGAVRISFGYMSTFEDAKEFINFIVKSFIPMPSPAEKGCVSAMNLKKFSTNGIYLKSITIYPIKSCKGFNADTWPLSDSGLLHDREWILKSPSGEILTQKKVPGMSLISTLIDLSQGMMFVESPPCGEKLSINLEQCYGPKEEIVTQSQRYEVHGYGDDINLWFTKAISRPCLLFKCVDSQLYCFGNKSGSVGMCRDVQSKLTFVNEAQFLLISEESVSDLNTRLSSKEKEKGNTGEPIHVSPMRFRPNLVISGAPRYAEDNWRSLTIGKAQFKSIGGCNRCQMINLDTLSEQTLKSKEPLKTLASYRRTKGKILFGIMLRSDNGSKDDTRPQLQVGQRVYPS